MRLRRNTLGLVLCGVGLASVGIAWAVFAGHDRWLRNGPNRMTVVRYTFYVDGDRVVPFRRGVDSPPPGSLGLAFDATLQSRLHSIWPTPKRPDWFGWLWGELAWDHTWGVSQMLQSFEVPDDPYAEVYPDFFPSEQGRVDADRVPSDLVDQIEDLITTDLRTLPDVPDFAFEPHFASAVPPDIVRDVALPVHVNVEHTRLRHGFNTLDRITPAWLLPLVDALTLGGFVCVPAGVGCLAWGVTGGPRRRRRLERGQCPSCGYDLTDLPSEPGTPHRCPECGQAG